MNLFFDVLLQQQKNEKKKKNLQSVTWLNEIIQAFFVDQSKEGGYNLFCHFYY